MQFNHKPAKMFLTKKERMESAKPQVYLGFAHIVY